MKTRRRRPKPFEPSLPGLIASGRQRADPDFWRERRENEEAEKAASEEAADEIGTPRLRYQPSRPRKICGLAQASAQRKENYYLMQDHDPFGGPSPTSPAIHRSFVPRSPPSLKARRPVGCKHTSTEDSRG